MGNETSQLSSPDRHDRRVFGPAMPPSPSDNDSENGQVIGPAMSPLPSYNEPDQSRGDQEASQDDGLHNPHYLADGLPRFAPEFVPRTATPNERRHETLNSADDEPRVILSFARRGSPPSAQSPPPLADGLPKYEPVPEGGNLKYERVLAYGGHEDALVAFNQTNGVQGSSSGILDPRQIKTESVADHDLPFAIAGPLDDVREVRQNESTAAPRWLHKREDQDPNDMPLTDTRTDSEREADAALPDLLPCQVKTEPPSDSDSDSPSAARLQRLSRSRSRSVASTSRSAVQADQVLGLTTNAQRRPALFERESTSPEATGGTTASGRSSTGSNASIPAQNEFDNVPRSRSASHSGSRSRSRSSRSSRSSRNSAQASGEAAGAEPPTAATEASPPRKKIKRANLGRKKAPQPTETTEEADIGEDDAHGAVEVSGSVQDSQPAAAEKAIQNRVSDDEVPIDDTPILEHEIEPSASARHTSSPEHELPVYGTPTTYQVPPAAPANSSRKTPSRKAKASLALSIEEPEPSRAPGVAAPAAPETVAGGGGAATASRQRPATRAPRNKLLTALEVGTSATDEGGVVAAPEITSAPTDENIEPAELASQPHPQPKGKGKGKKRKLKGKSAMALSLSQIEGDEDTTEGQLSTFSQKARARDAMRGGSNDPEVIASQEPSPVSKSRKVRKRRRTAGASEDEMETFLAAGPSRSRKKAKTSNNLGSSDDETAKKTKRKFNTGPWDEEEMAALGRVVDEFLDDYGMTTHELNQLIHSVPSKADARKYEFWNRVDVAISRRTRKQIVERARRMYHNFVARGTWTEEQKEEVHELFETHGKKWAEIAAIINRDQKDVRDYWRNNYLVHETQVKSRWKEDEEARLKDVVEEALTKIRVMRENNDDFRPRPRANGIDDEALIDWQQISQAMGLTRSRQQCKWKWTDMREKGKAGDASIGLPTQLRNSIRVGGTGNHPIGISEELASAREDYRGMSDEEKYSLVEAIFDSGARDDAHIRWSSLVNERFRTKWHRPSLKLVWYRLRNTCPNYEDEDVETNARHLLNYYATQQSFRRLEDNQVDDQVEELLVRGGSRGKLLWKKPSDDPRAIRERQRRSSRSTSRASTGSRLTRKVSSDILRIEGSEDEAGTGDGEAEAGRGQRRGRGRRNGKVSSEILRIEGSEDEAGTDDLEAGRGQRRGKGRRNVRDDVPIRIPKHLKGQAAKKALEAARGKALARSASIAFDSDSE